MAVFNKTIILPALAEYERFVANAAHRPYSTRDSNASTFGIIVDYHIMRNERLNTTSNGFLLKAS